MVFQGPFQLKPMIFWFCATAVLLECFGLSEANPSCRAAHISVFYFPLWQYFNIVESAWPYSPMPSVLPSGTAGLALPKLEGPHLRSLWLPVLQRGRAGGQSVFCEEENQRMFHHHTVTRGHQANHLKATWCICREGKKSWGVSGPQMIRPIMPVCPCL